MPNRPTILRQGNDSIGLLQDVRVTAVDVQLAGPVFPLAQVPTQDCIIEQSSGFPKGLPSQLREAFEVELDPILRLLHDGAVHTGHTRLQIRQASEQPPHSCPYCSKPNEDSQNSGVVCVRML